PCRPSLCGLASRPPTSPVLPYTTLFRSFADRGRMVAQRFEYFGDGHLIGMEAVFGPVVQRTMDADPVRVAPREQASPGGGANGLDRKSTRLNSSHVKISYAVFCLKHKNT